MPKNTAVRKTLVKDVEYVAGFYMYLVQIYKYWFTMITQTGNMSLVELLALKRIDQTNLHEGNYVVRFLLNMKPMNFLCKKTQVS